MPEGWKGLVATVDDAVGKGSSRYIVICSSIISLHTVTSYLEEMLFKRLHFHQAFFLVMVMCLMYSALYLIHIFVFEGPRSGPRIKAFSAARERGLSKSLFWLCMAYAGSNSVSKLALDYVSIPTQIVFKSCKLVAVMLGATVILRKTYSFFEYLIAVGLVTGMGCFAAADLFERKEGDNSADSQWKTISGLVLLVGSLFCDSVLGNLQELVQKGNVCHEAELMYVQSLFSGLVLLLWTGISGELTQGILLCIKSREVVVCIIVWSLCNMLGVVLLLKVAGEFSAVTAVLTSFIRKFSSLLVSYAIFPKQLTMSHVAGLALVFSSVGAHAWHKLKRNKGSEDLRDHDKDYDHRRLSEMERLEPGEDESARKTSPRATPTSNGSVGQSHFFGGVTHPSGGVTHLSHENPASAGSGTATQLVEARL